MIFWLFLQINRTLQFYFHELIAQAPGDKIIVVAGGFRTAEDTHCTEPLVDI